ncbi:MAG TPA: hypothetical protein PLU24_06145, partial [Candidatus Omnitrophota bacterium]|nr:hypothetical protein [Candidatus Omnitrophota bacterium]
KFKVKTLSVVDEENVDGTVDFLYPYEVRRSLRLFGREEVINEIYAQDHRSVKITKKLNGKDQPVEVLSGEKEFTNVLLLLYRLRIDPNLCPGKTYKIALPTQNFELKVKDVRKLKIPMGQFDAFYIESVPAKYRIWISTREDRLPLRLQGLVAGGMMYLVANSVTNQ